MIRGEFVGCDFSGEQLLEGDDRTVIWVAVPKETRVGKCRVVMLDIDEFERNVANAERGALWHQVAEVLATELARWGHGDMHYGRQKRDQSVVDALAVYERAKESDQ